MNGITRRALGWLAIGAMLLGLAPGPSHAADIAALLKPLQQVDREGTGNDTAREAWARLAALDAAQLPALLAGIDEANSLAANWIRAAVDAIAERTLAAGQALPTAELETFLRDTRHAPRARRLAFEWLARVDPAAPDRLIPGLLEDPSVEFRRDAVARLLSAATEKFNAQDNAAATALYQQALRGARDADQVDEIEQKLKTLGTPIDVARHYGFLLQWKVIGPFDNTSQSGFDVAYPPETKLDFTAVYPGKGQEARWVDCVSTNRLGLVDLNQTLGKHKGSAAYATTEFVADAAREVEFRYGTPNATKLWLNGELLSQFHVYHAGDEVDQYLARGKLRPGRNVILLKVCQNEQTESWAQDWTFKFRVCDAAGTAVLAQDRAGTSAANQP